MRIGHDAQRVAVCPHQLSHPINVRYAREYRDDPSVLEKVLVPTPSGAQVPLSQVAEIKTVTGPPMIRSEDGKLVGFVFLDTTRANRRLRGRRARGDRP
ncbi:MAG: hypothetical protein WKG01_01770 [Kofleriaceae bacterium]